MRSTIPLNPKKPYISACPWLRKFFVMSSPRSSYNFAELLKGISTKIPIADKTTFIIGSSGILESVGPGHWYHTSCNRLDRLFPFCLSLARSVPLRRFICRTSPINHHPEMVKNIVPATAWPMNPPILFQELEWSLAKTQWQWTCYEL